MEILAQPRGARRQWLLITCTRGGCPGPLRRGCTAPSHSLSIGGDPKNHPDPGWKGLGGLPGGWDPSWWCLGAAPARVPARTHTHTHAHACTRVHPPPHAPPPCFSKRLFAPSPSAPMHQCSQCSQCQTPAVPAVSGGPCPGTIWPCRAVPCRAVPCRAVRRRTHHPALPPGSPRRGAGRWQQLTWPLAAPPALHQAPRPEQRRGPSAAPFPKHPQGGARPPAPPEAAPTGTQRGVLGTWHEPDPTRTFSL